jgi:VanZ family protein
MERPATGLRRLWWLIGYVQIATVCLLSLTPGVPGPDFTASDKVGHFLAYLVLALWFAQVVRIDHWRRLALLLIGMGLLLEVLQIPLPKRFFSAWDAAANIAGVAFGWALARLGLNEGLRVGERVVERWFKAR